MANDLKTEPKCAVVIPIYRKPTQVERLSLECVLSVLETKPKFIVQPASLGYCKKGFSSVYLEDRHFSSLNSYAWLMASPWFYEMFLSYEYILIYQLDCLIFADALDEFCGLGYDYMAPPFLANYEHWPLCDLVGVGGFSLRRVVSHISMLNKVLSSTNEKHMLASVINTFNAEDVFWGHLTKQIDPDFQVSTIDDSLRFGFNGDPYPYLARTRGVAPIGCHHWLYHGGTSYYLSLLPFSSARVYLWRLILKLHLFRLSNRSLAALPFLIAKSIIIQIINFFRVLLSFMKGSL
jgi:hypothetical protein